jgi:hypothetical protein
MREVSGRDQPRLAKYFSTPVAAKYRLTAQPR